MKETLAQLITRLDDGMIPYMLTGSIAVNFYTVPRSTQDIDLVVEFSPEVLENVISQFKDNFYIDTDEVRREVKRGGMFNLIYLPSFTRIDFIPLNNQPYEQTKFSRKRLVNFEGLNVWMISAEDLILSKIQWIQQIFSEKQAQDIHALLQEHTLDTSYIQTWKTTLNLNSYGLL